MARAPNMNRGARERQLLGVAEKLIAERGYAGLTMSELASRAGVTKPVIYDVIGSKDDVYERCVARAARDLEAALADSVAAHADDPEAVLLAAHLAFFAYVETHRTTWRALFTDSAGGRHAELIERLRERQQELVASVLAQFAQRTGTDLPQSRARMAARQINGAAEALAQWWLRHPRSTPQQLAESCSSLMLPGIERLTGWDGSGRP